MSEGGEGLAAVLQANRARFLRFLAARLGNPDEAEDVLQDIWLKLGNAAPSGPVADPVAYLFRVVDNAARDRKRSATRRRALEERWAGQDGGDIEIDRTPTPEDVVIERSRLRRVEAALGELPERTSYIFRAFRIDGRPQKELAAELDISLSAVEKHLQRAYRTVMAIQHEIGHAETGEG